MIAALETSPKIRNAANECHALSREEVAELLGVDLEKGLSCEDARERQRKFGPNRITNRRGRPAWLKFLHQFNEPLVYILLIASAITGLLGEWIDSSVIFAVVFANAIVGFVQETRAEKAIQALAKMVRMDTTVRRDENKMRISAEDLVPGDVVLLQAGDRVPADIRLFQTRSLQVDESTLTGESVPAPLMNRLFHSAAISAESWLRIILVALLAFTIVELEKWIRFGRKGTVER